MGILNKKSSKKEEVKTVQAYGCDAEEMVVYSGYVKAPCCGNIKYVSEVHKPPSKGHCNRCNQQFNIEWE